MTRTLLIGLLALSFTPTTWGQSAREKVKLRVAMILDPLARPLESTVVALPAARPIPRRLADPQLPWGIADAEPPRIPSPKFAPPRPHPKPELGALAHFRAAPDLPQPIAFNAGQPVIQWAPDTRTPSPMPILAVYARDRASLADPSLEASVAATLTPQQPERLAPAAFSPANLPDPFEHAQTIRPSRPWPELHQMPAFLPIR